MADWCRTVGENAMSFSAGDVESLQDLKVVPELVRLPYPICWFEAELRYLQPHFLMRLGLLIATMEDGTYAPQAFDLRVVIYAYVKSDSPLCRVVVKGII